MNDEYSDAFKSIVPDAPSSDGWADGARRKRRNRGRVVAGVAAAAAIGLVVPLALTIGGNSTLIATPGKSESPSPQVPTPSPVPATDDPGESNPPSDPVMQPTPFETDACAGVTSGEVTSTDLPDGELPDGPTKIWLCDASPSGMPGVVGPLEPLESRELTKDAVSYYNALPTAEPRPACGDDFGHAYSVIHEYADSTKYVVAVQTSSCDVITTGAQTKTGGQSYIDELVTMWQSQRDDARPVQTRPGPFCPYLGSVFPIDPVADEFTTGVACVGWDAHNGVTMGPAEETPLPSGVLAELPDQMATATTDIPDGQPIGGGIVLLTAAGDPFSLQRGENDVFSWQDSDGRWFFTPTGDLADELEKIFAN